MKLYNLFKKIREMEATIDNLIDEVQLLRKSSITGGLPQYDYQTYRRDKVFKLKEK